MGDAESTHSRARAVRDSRWLLSGLTGLLSAIAMSLGTSGWFAPTLAILSAIVAGVGLHRFGRSGARALSRA